MQFLVSTFIDGAIMFLKTEKRIQFKNHARYISNVCISEPYKSDCFAIHIITKRVISISIPYSNESKH